MSWEGKLRRLVWLFRDEPETFARVAAIAGAVLGVVMLHKLRKYSASFEGPAPDQALAHGSAAAGGHHLHATIQRALKFAQSAGALYPLSVGETAVCRDRGIPFALTALDPNAQAAKAAAAQSGRRLTARASEALGLKLFRARKDAVLQDPHSSLAARARAWAAYALSPLLGVPRALRFSLRTAMAQTGDAFAVLPVELFVGNVTPQHAVVLNKFPVLPEHCVIVTRAFRRQDEPLTQEDMRALWLCVRDLRGLGFFNCGTAAGASQPRKHMQVVPLDAIAASRPQLAAAGVPPVPMEAAVNAHLEAQGWRTRPGVPFRLADLQFKHAACSLGGDVPALSDEAAAAALHGWYTALLRAAYAPAGVDSSASASAATRAPATSAAGDALLHAPHSLLLTPSWMMAVPRSTDRWGPTGDVPVNSLAYAGFLLTRASSVAALQADGPMAVLRKCGLEL